MNILKFYTTLLYSFKTYFDDIYTGILSFIGVIGFNLLSLLAFYCGITNKDFRKSIFFADSSGYFNERIYVFFVDIIPLAIIFGIIYLFNRTKIKRYFEEFENESEKEKIKRIKITLYYLLFTVVFFLFSAFTTYIF